jgi:hypothetical protein
MIYGLPTTSAVSSWLIAGGVTGGLTSLEKHANE